MNRILFITLLISTMGLFGFFNKSGKKQVETNTPIVGMILLEDPNSLDMEGVITDLKKSWNLTITSKDLGESASVLNINGYNIAIANMPVAIPGDEASTAAAYNYFWENGVEETKKHKGHIILAITNAGKDPVAENILFNQVAASILRNSNAIGLYLGNRTLMLEKEFYLTNSEILSEGDLPLYNWIYFGLRAENGRQSVYTYGLADFGKQEMEIVNSTKDLEDLSQLMYNMASYVIAYDVTLKDGETIGMSADQKLKISLSKGKFLEGKTLKIDY